MNPNGHQRTLLPLHGRAAVVQRYAIDYFKVDKEGSTYSGDQTKSDSYYAYGEEVLAVADAIVAYTADGVPENDLADPNSRAVPINLQTVGGNYVMLGIGAGRYAFYAHLKPGSIRVSMGDHVSKGQVIGLLGLSRNTPNPHLHLHVGDTTEPLGSEGLPYVSEAFDVVGECLAPPATWSWFEECIFSKPDPRDGEIPLAWKLVNFGQ